MASIFVIPLSSTPQTFKITLGAVDYRMTLTYQNVDQGGWVLDIADSNNVPIVCGIPLVTGIDLLGQYSYYQFGGQLFVQTAHDPDATPTFDNLGTEALLFWVTP